MEQMWCNVILELWLDFGRFENSDFISTVLTQKDRRANDLKTALPLICESVQIRKH